MAKTKNQAPLEVTTSSGFTEWLAECGASIAFTTDRAGKLFLVGHNDEGKLSIFERSFDRTRGLAMAGDSLLMAKSRRSRSR